MQLVVKSGANPAEANLGLGTAYLEAGRVNEALAPLQEAARLDPSRPETYVQLSRAHRAKGQLGEAEKALTLGLKAGAAGLGTLYHGVDADLYMEQGLVRMQQGRLEAAAEAFQRVLALNPAHEPAKRQLAEVRKLQQDKTRAKKPGEGS